MILLVDTREQSALQFSIDEVLTEVRREKLDVGDYMVRFIDGTVPPVSFERKSLSDLFGTMGSGYKRFKAEMARAKDAGIQLIIIVEGTVSDVLQGPPYSQIKGISMLRKLMMLWVRYDIPIVFCQGPKEAAVIVRQFFEAVGRNWVKEASE